MRNIMKRVRSWIPSLLGWTLLDRWSSLWTALCVAVVLVVAALVLGSWMPIVAVLIGGFILLAGRVGA